MFIFSFFAKWDYSFAIWTIGHCSTVKGKKSYIEYSKLIIVKTMNISVLTDRGSYSFFLPHRGIERHKVLLFVVLWLSLIKIEWKVLFCTFYCLLLYYLALLFFRESTFLLAISPIQNSAMEKSLVLCWDDDTLNVFVSSCVCMSNGWVPLV